MMKKKPLFLIVLTVVLLISQITYAISDNKVLRLESLGLIESYESERVVTRGEAVNSFVRMLVKDVYETNGSGFVDVPEEHKYADAIGIAKDIGIIDGTSDGMFRPDEAAVGMHLVKMAVNVLGFGAYAEQKGGYEEGYKAVAKENGLVPGFDLSGNVTMSQFAAFLDQMLDIKPLEAGSGTNKFETSKYTLYEKIINRSDITHIKEGIVTGSGKAMLNGYNLILNENEISVNGEIFTYYGNDGLELLGKNVSVYYSENEKTGDIEITGILPKSKNTEISIENDEIISLTVANCRYYNSETQRTSKALNISSKASFIYNGVNFVPGNNEIELTTGDVRLVDNNGDKLYDVVLIDEYESFLIDRVSLMSTSVYFDNNVLFRGKTYFKFDFEDDDKDYTIYNSSGAAVSFEDIKEDTVITIKSDLNCMGNVVTISEKTVTGIVNNINVEDYEITVDDVTYDLYKPNAMNILSKCDAGKTVTFYLNHKDEIVFSDMSVDGLYGYVTGASVSDEEKIVLKIVSSGYSDKEVEIVADEEIIKYNYQNSKALSLTSADAVIYTGPTKDGAYVEEKRVSASRIDAAKLKGSVIRYKLNGEGYISNLMTTEVDFDTLKVAPKYNFNGKLNSFGGLSHYQAFFVGKNTSVICIPDNKNPGSDDYDVYVTVTDKGSEIVMPVNVDEETQIAECVLLMKTMNATDPKPFSETTQYSIVGKVGTEIDEEKELVYRLDVLTGGEQNAPFIKKDSFLSPVVDGLQCGDIILYNTKSSGEIANVKKVVSLYNYGNIYGEDVDGSVFGKVTDIKINRLDDFLNEMVDVVTLDLDGTQKVYKLYREDGPAVYTYSQSGGYITAASADDIYEDGKLFLFLKENIVKVAVIFKE